VFKESSYTSSPDFHPRDHRDSPAVSGCDQNPDDCRQEYAICVAGVVGSCLTHGEAGDADMPTVDYYFTLKPAPNPVTGNSENWLPGKSTNFGTDTANDPDYEFECPCAPGASTDTSPRLNLQVMQVSPMKATHFAVLSRDYGGAARLYGRVVIQGVTVDIDVIDEMDGSYPSWTPPSCVSLRDFVLHPFASLPYDHDCNGIDDAWEDQHSFQTDESGNPKTLSNGRILHLPIDWDQEPGYAATSPKGDGWSVHDEYRGFHYVADDGATPHWGSTDPMTKLDVFFWDAGFKLEQKSEYRATDHPPNPSLFTQALRRNLCLQGNADEMGYGVSFTPALGPVGSNPPIPDVPNFNDVKGANYCYGGATINAPSDAPPTLSKTPVGVNEYDPTKGPGPDSPPNPLRFWYRRVNADQANAKSADPERGVLWFNSNSVTSANTQGNHTVVVYFYSPLGKETLGATTNNLSSGRACGPKDLDGLQDCDVPRRYRIAINYPLIRRLAMESNREQTGTTPETLLAKVVAHETGHWYQQNHAQRPACCTFAPGGKASSIDWSTFTFPGNALTSETFLIGLQTYDNKTRQNPKPTDSVTCAASGTPRKDDPHSTGQNGMPVYTKGPLTSTNGSSYSLSRYATIAVNTIQNELMDWTTNFAIGNPLQWHFDPANLADLCAQNPCPQAKRNQCIPTD
jgi:hypothetical protein